MGVATGIVQEFQFGMNWSEYSRFVGDIFGAPLAIEALLAFFMESTFLGVWIFGWEKLSKKVHLAAIWLVAIGSSMSALWILIANSFMQEPMGYAINEATGRATMNDFGALITNPHAWLQFPHVLTSGVTTAAMFVLGISAFHLIRKTKVGEAVFQKSFRLATVYGIIGVLLVVFIGHTQGQHMVQAQPAKMAAAEALWETEDPADLTLIGFFSEERQETIWAITLPNMLSVMSYNSLTGEVKGLKNLQAEYEVLYGPGNYIPPVFLCFWSFRLMVGTGSLMLVLLAFSLYVCDEGAIRGQDMVAAFVAFCAVSPLHSQFHWLAADRAWAPALDCIWAAKNGRCGFAKCAGDHRVVFSDRFCSALRRVLIVADVYLLVKYARQPELG